MLKFSHPIFRSLAFTGLFLGFSTTSSAQHSEFDTTIVGQYDVPWALEFLPDHRLLLSEMKPALATRLEQQLPALNWSCLAVAAN